MNLCYSTSKNISKNRITTNSNKITNKYIAYPDKTSKRQAEGGLRLQNKYKHSIENKPLITIITVVFNNEKTLERTILSVINQTYDNIEYIIIDGGSSDSTLDIIKNNEDYVDYYISEPDSGIYYAMNKGLELASGEYILFMNSNDLFFNHEVVKEVILKGYKNDILFGDGICEGQNTKHPLPIDENNNVILDLFFKDNSLCHQSSFIKRVLFEQVGLYDTKFRIISDHAFFTKALKIYCSNFRYLDIPVAIVDITGISMTNRNLLLKENILLMDDLGMRKKTSILLVYPHNFYNRDSGVNQRFYKIVKTLSKFNVEIDLIAVTMDLKDWLDFEKQNEDEGNIIRKHYLVKPDTNMSKHKLFNLYSDIDINELGIDRTEYDAIFMCYCYGYSILKHFKSKYNVCFVEDLLSINMAHQINKLNDFPLFLLDEIYRMSFFDAFVYVSYDELTFFSHIFKQKSYFLPHTEEKKYLVNNNKTGKILFLGHWNSSNIEGYKWLIDEVIKYLDKNIIISVAGKICECIEDNPNIEKLGFVDDLDNLYAKTKIVICPLLSGTGMKIKVMEAMSHGIPIVSTSFGLDGIPDKFSTGILVSNYPQEFAENIIKLLKDDSFYDTSHEKLKNYYNILYNNFNTYSIVQSIIDNIQSDIILKNNYVKNNNLNKNKLKFLEHIFSVYTMERFVEITILGIKISIKRKKH